MEVSLLFSVFVFDDQRIFEKLFPKNAWKSLQNQIVSVLRDLKFAIESC